MSRTIFRNVCKGGLDEYLLAQASFQPLKNRAGDFWSMCRNEDSCRNPQKMVAAYEDELFFAYADCYRGIGRVQHPDSHGSSNDRIHCRERLGGMLNFYYREAA